MANVTIFAAIQNALVTRAIPDGLQRPLDRGRWWSSLIREPFTGAWQRNMEERTESVVSYNPVYSCITLIASDVAKCRLKLVEQDSNGIWNEIQSPAFSPVIRKPNHYQNRVQFFESWMISKLLNGNTYVLKERDARGVVIALYILDPEKTKPLVAPNGDIYYQLSKDNLAGLQEDSVIVPSSEIIHDMTTMKYHWLCGVPPMAPAKLAATQGLNIQRGSIRLFANNSKPGGILTAPGAINEATAARLKEHWESNFTGENVGRVAVLGDGLTYEAMAQTAVESQLIEQLKISARGVCTSFNVPPHKIHVENAPSNNSTEVLNSSYYTDCIQKHMEAIEACLDDGLGLNDVPGKVYGTEFEVDDLLRMDTAALFKTLADGVRGGFIAPNEARKRVNYKPVTGGDSPMMQHQDYSLAALAKRDASEDPFAKAPGSSSPAPAAPAAATNVTTDESKSAEWLAANPELVAWEAKQGLDRADPIKWAELEAA